MKTYERSIKIAFDKISGEILDADELLAKPKDAFEIRRKYHKKELDLSCCECEQDLTISGSKYDRLHFKHKPRHSDCILSSSNLTQKDLDCITKILKLKESERHKELKNKIGELLKTIPDVDINSISIDNKCIIRDNGKRRPDVYCKFKDKEIVFEIQLSQLSLSYILSRYEFYKEQGIYLIWILDNFDIHNQGTLERDIKYLSKYENFFKLDENDTETLKLECEYKYPFLTEDNRLLIKWLKKSVTLNQIKFDNENFQIYYYNFGDNKTKTEIIQRKKVEEIEKAEKEWLEKERLAIAETKALNIKANIARIRKMPIQNFSQVYNQLFQMNKFETEILNEILDLRGKNAIITWIDSAKQNDINFLEFIFNAKKISIDINETDRQGRTALQAIISNNNLSNTFLIKELFKVGYRLTESDEIALIKLKEEDKELAAAIPLFNRLKKRYLVDDVFSYSKVLFIIETARQKKIIYYNFSGNEWISFANNAVQYYSKYWEYIRLAFKYYGLWDILIKNDINGSFQKKIQSLRSTSKENYYIDEVFIDLYPELDSIIQSRR